MSGIADDVVELLDGYQHALADAAIVRGADPDAAWAEALKKANNARRQRKKKRKDRGER